LSTGPLTSARDILAASGRREPIRAAAASPLSRRTGIEELPHGLLERVRRGQPEARAELFRRYAPKVREILFLQGMCDDVDDGVQEVFVKVFRAELPREETFLGWFYRVILNTGRDLGRRRRSRQGLMKRLLTAPSPATAAAAADESARIGDPVLREALDGLGPEFREVVALRFFADFSLDEIATCLDVPTGTVKSRLHTAMARLRVSLTDAGVSP
jgi:RNA polymerase sigma-70 factor, ECF subfamily